MEQFRSRNKIGCAVSQKKNNVVDAPNEYNENLRVLDFLVGESCCCMSGAVFGRVSSG